MSVVNLAAWRADRAARRAREANHPVASGGPHADVLTWIEEQLVPRGYRLGLWTGAGGTLSHAVRPLTFGVAETACGGRISEPRRADPALPLCGLCFPS